MSTNKDAELTRQGLGLSISSSPTLASKRILPKRTSPLAPNSSTALPENSLVERDDEDDEDAEGEESFDANGMPEPERATGTVVRKPTPAPKDMNNRVHGTEEDASNGGDGAATSSAEGTTPSSSSS